MADDRFRNSEKTPSPRQQSESDLTAEPMRYADHAAGDSSDSSGSSNASEGTSLPRRQSESDLTAEPMRYADHAAGDSSDSSGSSNASEGTSLPRRQSESDLTAEPMRYADHAAGDSSDTSDPSEENKNQAVFTEDDLLFPPFSVVKKPKRMLLLKSFLWGLSVVLVSFALFFVYYLISKNSPQSTKQDNEKIPYNRTDVSYAEDNSLPDAPDVSADPDGPQISSVHEDSDVSTNTVHDAYQKASPSVVCITSYQSGSDYVLDKLGDGSGIILSEDGYITTNSHVVNDSVNTGVMVTVFDGSQYLGTVIGVDKKTDLAVLKIDAHKLTPAVFSDSDQLFVGQEVYAIGNPGGSNFSNSLTKGTVSALDRILSNNGYVRYIQTDAAINPGNSGGPLINEAGMVVGMNTSKIVSTNYEGMGFSIPCNKVAEIVNELIRHGFVSNRATISIEGTTCNLYESKLKNIPQGMVITAISFDSPLAATAAKEKDIITHLNGVRVKSSYEFIDELSKYRPGDVVKIALFRAATDINRSPERFEVEIKLKDDSGS